MYSSYTTVLPTRSSTTGPNISETEPSPAVPIVFPSSVIQTLTLKLLALLRVAVVAAVPSHVAADPYVIIRNYDVIFECTWNT